jgi:hypothetical protein
MRLPGEAIPNLDALNTIVRYEAILDRRLHRTLVHLERLQRARKGEYVPAHVSISAEGPPNF